MKRIKKTLMASIFACAAFNAQAEVNPLSFGAKIGASAIPYVGINNDARMANKQITHNFLDHPFVSGGIYGEYAFNDYIGLGLEVNYLMQGFTLTAEKDSNNSKDGDSSIKMTSHGVSVPLSLYAYPLGREEGEGIIKLMLGPSFYLPCATSYSQDNAALSSLSEDQKKESPTFDVGMLLGVDYEFPFGLSIGGKCAYMFMNRFNLSKGASQTIFSGVNHLNQANLSYVTLGLGYNFASLFSE